MVAQIMPAKLLNSGAFQKIRPGCVEAGLDPEYARIFRGLLAPPREHADRLIIERDVAGLAILRRSSFNRQDSSIEVDGRLSEF